MVRKSDKLYVIKTAPNRERSVVDLINKYYLCKEGEEFGQVVVVKTEEEIETEAKKGRAWSVRIPDAERQEMLKKEKERIAAEKGIDVSEVNLQLSSIPKHREKLKRKTALGFFGAKLRRKEIDIDRRICLVDEVVVPQLKSYVVISTKDRKYANQVVRKIRFAWKVLDGTVSRRELDMNIKELEERTRVDVGDIVVPMSGTMKDIKSEVVGVTFDGRLRLKSLEGSVPIEFTISKDKLSKGDSNE